MQYIVQCTNEGKELLSKKGKILHQSKLRNNLIIFESAIEIDELKNTEGVMSIRLSRIFHLI